MKRGLVLSAMIMAVMLVSFGTLVSAQAVNYGANVKTGIAFNPDQGVADVNLNRAPLGAPDANASASANENDETAIGCTLANEIKTCSVSGYPKFTVDASVKVQMIDGTLKLIATSPDREAEITFTEDGSKLTLKPGASFTLNNVADDTPWCNRLLNRRNIIRTPTAVAAVRGTEETGVSRFLNGLCAKMAGNRVRTTTAVAAVRGTEETGFSKFLKNVMSRLNARASVRTPTAVAAVRGTEEA